MRFSIRHSCLYLTGAVLFAAANTLVAQDSRPPRFTPEVEEFVKNFKPGGQDFTGAATSLSAEESVKRLVLPEGFAAELVASEPIIRQPIDLRFDERGRLWVVQYLQYPFPAGVTITSVRSIPSRGIRSSCRPHRLITRGAPTRSRFSRTRTEMENLRHTRPSSTA